ncbi:hypothetical protein J3Q64DRAFT_1835771 [Phycomyces blakesleeanus]|uniref:F-box domain-containing protein n=2 Tax=Phycomyces blakesleeanus TaxID=4837 RepID=A0A167MAZ9_PHYB8|nr:hypothetical protein PHYBLDRAFT_146524 [Phycomyces blakesleeanus NRRL 1555(-)]OAD72324.1 hypothetical protein PHYBLDRAFT_146524 [Phycomyces blakesleeanus NRRL 1555(-)]|eukprot:XP_018290364.1 hypothetical protein PHYBLDRAFT_146524 [Phycomyces blakesleeanus NRRL 1555(-)]
MLASDLPCEILINIANLVSFKDKSPCSLTCKAWQAPFQEAMLNEIVIYDQKQLEEICDEFITNDIVYQKNGQYMRYLYLYGEFQASDEQLHILQQHFRNIKYLYVKQARISNFNFGATANWRLWDALVELQIVLDDVRIENAERKFLDIMSCLPRLKRLELIRHTWLPVRLRFTLEDFETLHEHLPQLKNLSLSTDLTVLSAVDMIHITDVSPAKGLVFFDIDSKTTDFRWLSYFARKYPALHTLRWATCNNEITLDEHQDEAVALFKAIPTGFQNLRIASIRSEECPKGEHLIFWRSFCPSNIPIKHLTCRPYLSKNTPEVFEEIIKTCMRSFSKTLESLSIKCRFIFNTPFTITNSFNHCPRLVYLRIGYCNTSIELDVLLELCASLTNLRLSRGRLLVSSTASKNVSMCKLRVVEIHRSTVSAETLDYISSRCKKLDDIQLKNTKVIGSIFQNTRSLFIDMSGTRFERFCFENVWFSTLEDDENGSSNLNLIVISHPTIDQQTTDTLNTIPSEKVSPKNTIEYTWLYSSYKKDNNNSWSSVNWRLSKGQANWARKYFRNFELKRTLAGTKYSFDSTVEITGENWKEHLFNGFTTLKCGYIANLDVAA